LDYRFVQGSGGSFQNGGNWQPRGVPGSGDVALFEGWQTAPQPVAGPATVGKLRFLAGPQGYDLTGRFTTTGIASVGTEVNNTAVRLMPGTRLTTGKLVVANGGTVDDDQGGAGTVLTTGSTVISSGTATAALVFSELRLTENATWDNGGNVIVHPWGDFFIAAKVAVTIGGDLRIGALGSDSPGTAPPASASVLELSSLTVGHDVVLGDGADFAVGQSDVAIAGKVAVLGGGEFDLNEAPGSHASVSIAVVTLSPRASFVGNLGTLTGPGAAGSTVYNQGTISVPESFTIDGSVYDHGAILLGQQLSTGNLTVTGSLWSQSITFVTAGSHLVVGAFGGGDSIHGFVPGDTLFEPDLVGINYDSAEHLLTLLQTGGRSEVLHMVGDFSGERFVLKANGVVRVLAASAGGMSATEGTVASRPAALLHSVHLT